MLVVFGSRIKGNPLSEKSKSVRPAQSRTDTLIGADLRVEGNITSTGVLRIQGDVHGDVSCDADAGGTIIVGKSGNITGSVKASHIVVSGHVSGPLHSAESIEIQEGACVVGDAFYKVIDIQAGGVLEGTLMPGGLPDGDRLQQEYRIQMPEPAALDEHDTPPANAVAGGGAAEGGAGGEAPGAQAVSAGSGRLQDGLKAAAGEAASQVPGPDADTNAKPGVQDSPSAASEADSEKVVRVQGVNPAKPSGVFLLVSREPSVLFKKKREESGDGKRIEVPRGKTVSIAVAGNELVRVAEGREIEIFYQGRKVTSTVIESGTWMSFVPAPSRED